MTQPPSQRSERPRGPRCLEEVVDAVSAHPGHSGEWYAEHTGRGRRAVMYALRTAERLGCVYRTGTRRTTRWWLG